MRFLGFRVHIHVRSKSPKLAKSGHQVANGPVIICAVSKRATWIRAKATINNIGVNMHACLTSITHVQGE